MSKELKVHAWLVEAHSGFGEQQKVKQSVVLSPLTDDTYLGEGDEAHALCKVEDAEEAIKRVTDEAAAMKAGLQVASNAASAALARVRELEKDARRYQLIRSSDFNWTDLFAEPPKWNSGGWLRIGSQWTGGALDRAIDNAALASQQKAE